MKKALLYFLITSVPTMAFSNESISLDGDNIFYQNDNVEFNLYPKNSLRKIDTENGDIVSSYSPDKKHVLIYKTEEAYLYLENGDKLLVGKGYCELINLSNGCVLATESHDSVGICDSEWHDNDKLKTGNGIVKIPNKTTIVPPKYIIDDYELLGTFDYSIQSYLACYPVNSDNHNDYLKISNKLINDWNRKKEGEYLLKKLSEEQP